MYDKYGDTYYVGISPNSNLKDGDISPIVPINNMIPQQLKKADFKAIFQNKIMHNPAVHRQYFATIEDVGKVNEYHSKTKIKFDRKEIELQTVNKDNKEYLTLTQETIDYLKDMDKTFVMATVGASWMKDKYYSDWQTRKNRGINDSGTKRLKETYEHFQGIYDDVQKNFKFFVADFTRSLIELEQPFTYKFTDKNGDEKEIGVGVGNFPAAPIDDMINSIFGNVTSDDFIPAVNEERFKQKKESTCCLNYEMESKVFRKKDLPYKQSKQYIKDTKDFEEYKKSPDFTPYTPPPSFKEYKIKDFDQSVSNFLNYVNDLNEVMQSPLIKTFIKLKPYLNKKLSGTGWWLTSPNGVPTINFSNTNGSSENEKQWNDYFK